MKQKTLLQLVPPQQESDYLEHFQALSAVNLEIRQQGATPERLLRKSILEVDIGNFSAGLDAARDAAEMRPEWGEAHYQEAMTLLLLAFTKAGVLAGAPGMEPPLGSIRTLMDHATRGFSRALQFNHGDEEVKEDLAVLARFLARHEDESSLRDALQGLRVQ